MKPLLLAFLLCPLFCWTQKNYDSAFFAKMQNRKIERSYELPNHINIPFKAVLINDVRADTTCIGFIKQLDSHIKKINFPNGLKQEISSFINNDYVLSNSDSSSLYVFIKTFRISNYTNEAFVKENNIIIWNAGLILNAELFEFNNGTFHALYKIDTVFSLKNTVEASEKIPSEIFHLIFYKLEGKSSTEFHVGKKEFSYQQVDNHINEIFNSPILHDSILNKGVYKTFVEFKNNNPSIKDFD